MQEENVMNMVWDRFVSNDIRELGYDINSQTLAVVFANKEKRYHAPVPYPVYAALFHSTFAGRQYRKTVERKLPVVPEY
jgi:hypothetical protein